MLELGGACILHMHGLGACCLLWLRGPYDHTMQQGGGGLLLWWPQMWGDNSLQLSACKGQAREQTQSSEQLPASAGKGPV